MALPILTYDRRLPMMGRHLQRAQLLHQRLLGNGQIYRSDITELVGFSVDTSILGGVFYFFVEQHFNYYFVYERVYFFIIIKKNL